jgi:hypothetical protein
VTDVISRGRAAQQLLADETINEAFSAVLHDTMTLWAKTPEEDAPKRERLYFTIVAVDRLRGKLRSYVQDGTLAAAEAERESARTQVPLR